MTSTETISLSEVSEKISQIWWIGLAEEEQKYREWYKTNKETFIEFIKRFDIPKEILIRIYKRSVKEGLPPIEDLSREEKMSLWNESGKNITISKALYVLKTI